MLTEREYILIQFFNKDVAKSITSDEITNDMVLKGIKREALKGIDHFGMILHKMYSAGFLSQPYSRTMYVQYLLTSLGEDAIHEYELAKRIANEEKENQNFIKDLEILNLHLQNENLQLQNVRERLEKANYNLEQQNKQSAANLITLQIKEQKNKRWIAVVSFILGAIVTNLKDLLELMKRLFQ